MPTVGEHDIFEERYLDKLKNIWSSKGLKVEYPKDRAALDGGLHLYSGNQGPHRTVSQTRIWFQAKGKRTSTLSRDDFEGSSAVTVSVPAEQLRFWYAAPEPVYLIVYVESADVFLAEDVRDIVDRQWESVYQQVPQTQQDVTLKVQTHSILDDALIALMLRHQSMRVDGPSFRGRPLGHRFDPLRSEMNQLPSEIHGRLVDRVLEAHRFRTMKVYAAPATSPRHSRLRILHGEFHQTLEWQWPMGTTTGFEHDENELRHEAPVDFVHGDCLVIVDSSGDTSRFTDDESAALCAIVRESRAPRALVFVNTGELDGVGIWRGALSEFIDLKAGCDFWPIALGSLSYIVLVASLVYLEFAPLLTWRRRNYLY